VFGGPAPVFAKEPIGNLDEATAETDGRSLGGRAARGRGRQRRFSASVETDVHPATAAIWQMMAAAPGGHPSGKRRRRSDAAPLVIVMTSRT